MLRRRSICLVDGDGGFCESRLCIADVDRLRLHGCFDPVRIVDAGRCMLCCILDNDLAGCLLGSFQCVRHDKGDDLTSVMHFVRRQRHEGGLHVAALHGKRFFADTFIQTSVRQGQQHPGHCLRVRRINACDAAAGDIARHQSCICCAHVREVSRILRDARRFRRCVAADDRLTYASVHYRWPYLRRRETLFRLMIATTKYIEGCATRARRSQKLCFSCEEAVIFGSPS